jgi:hypothetical protein
MKAQIVTTGIDEFGDLEDGSGHRAVRIVLAAFIKVTELHATASGSVCLQTDRRTTRSRESRFFSRIREVILHHWYVLVASVKEKCVS